MIVVIVLALLAYVAYRFRAQLKALLVKIVSPVKGQDPSPPSPVTQTPAPQAISDPVVVAPTAPVVAPVATGVDPTTAMYGDPNAVDPRFPNGPQAVGASFDPKKTNLGPEDFGRLFEPSPGATNYTITGPARIALMIDGAQKLGERAICSIDGGPNIIVGFGVDGAVAGGVLGQVGSGPHSFPVDHNVVIGVVRVQVNPA